MRKIINDGVEVSTRKSQTRFSDYLSLMLGKPRIRLNNLKTSLRCPCLGLNSIIDSINLKLVISTDIWDQTIYFEISVVGINFDFETSEGNCIWMTN